MASIQTSQNCSTSKQHLRLQGAPVRVYSHMAININLLGYLKLAAECIFFSGTLRYMLKRSRMTWKHQLKVLWLKLFDSP
jgi:hypothetical protein